MNLDQELQNQKNQSVKLKNQLIIAERNIKNKKGDIKDVSIETLRTVGLAMRSVSASINSMAMSSIKTTESLAGDVLRNVVRSNKEKFLFSTIGQINPILAALTSKMTQSTTFQNLVDKAKSKIRLPRLQKGGLVGKSGAFQLHAGEVVVPYSKTKKLFAKEKIFDEIAKDSRENRETLKKIHTGIESMRESLGGSREGKKQNNMIEGFNQFNTNIGDLNTFIEGISSKISSITKFVEIPFKFLYKPRGGYLKYLPHDNNVLANISKTLQVIFTFFAERLDSLRNFGRESALSLRSLVSYFTGVNLPPLRDDIERPWTVKGLFTRAVKAWKRSKEGSFFKNIAKSWSESKGKGIKRPYTFMKGIFNRPIQFYKQLQEVEAEKITSERKALSIFGPMFSPFVKKEGIKQTEWEDYYKGGKNTGKGKFTRGSVSRDNITVIKRIDRNISNIYTKVSKIAKDISTLVSEEGILQLVDILFEKSASKQTDIAKKQLSTSEKMAKTMSDMKKQLKESSDNNVKYQKQLKETIQESIESTKDNTKSLLDRLKEVSKNIKTGFLKSIRESKKRTKSLKNSIKKSIENQRKDLEKNADVQRTLPERIVRQFKKKIFNIYDMFIFFRKLFSPKSIIMSSLVGGLAYQIMKRFGGKGGISSMIKAAVAAGMFGVVRTLGFQKIFSLLLTSLTKLGGYLIKSSKILGIPGTVVGTSALIGGVKGYAQAQKKFGEPLGEKLGIFQKMGLATGEALKWGSFGLIDVTRKAQAQAQRAKKARTNLMKTNQKFLQQMKWRMSDKAYSILVSVGAKNAGESFGNLIHNFIIIYDDKNKIWVTEEEYLKSLPTMKEKIKFESDIAKKKFKNFKDYIGKTKTYKYISEKSKQLYLESIKPFATKSVIKILEEIKDSRAFDILVSSGMVVRIRNKWMTKEEMLRSNPKTSGKILNQRIYELDRRNKIARKALKMMEYDNLLRLNEDEFLLMIRKNSTEDVIKLVLSSGSIRASQSFKHNVLIGNIIRCKGKWVTSEEYLRKDLNLNKSNKMVIKEITDTNKGVLQSLKDQISKNKNLAKEMNNAALKRYKKNCSWKAYQVLTSSGENDLDNKFNTMVMSNQLVEINGKWKTIPEIATESKTRFIGSSRFIELLAKQPTQAVPVLSSGRQIRREDLIKIESENVTNQKRILSKFTKDLKKPIEEQTKAAMKIASNLTTISHMIVNNNVSTINNAGVVAGNIIDPTTQSITQGLVP